MQNFLYLCSANLISHKKMSNVRKYLGVCLLILGVLFLVVYRFALPENSLLIAGMVCEVAGILAYIFINKKG